MKNCQFSLVIPAYREKENLAWLLPELFKYFKEKKLPGEIFVVIDGQDKDSQALLQSFLPKNPLRYVIRKKSGDLSAAVLEGFKHCQVPILGVMDADGSHPKEALENIYKAISNPDIAMVIGSRFVKGGSCEQWPLKRRIISWVARLLVKPILRVKDPTSGFFFLKRTAFKNLDVLRVPGFKIGLALMAQLPKNKLKEIPIVFKNRRLGKSKFNGIQVIKYLKQLSLIYFTKLFCKKVN